MKIAHSVIWNFFYSDFFNLSLHRRRCYGALARYNSIIMRYSLALSILTRWDRDFATKGAPRRRYFISLIKKKKKGRFVRSSSKYERMADEARCARQMNIYGERVSFLSSSVRQLGSPREPAQKNTLYFRGILRRRDRDCKTMAFPKNKRANRRRLSHLVCPPLGI